MRDNTFVGMFGRAVLLMCVALMAVSMVQGIAVSKGEGETETRDREFYISRAREMREDAEAAADEGLDEKAFALLRRAEKYEMKAMVMEKMDGGSGQATGARYSAEAEKLRKKAKQLQVEADRATSFGDTDEADRLRAEAKELLKKADEVQETDGSFMEMPGSIPAATAADFALLRAELQEIRQELREIRQILATLAEKNEEGE